MDENEFKKTYKAITERYCPFEKAILSRRCECKQVERTCIAEREAASCKSSTAQVNCVHLKKLLRESARFALKVTGTSSSLTHAKEMKLQCGGLSGLQRVVFPERRVADQVDNIYGLVNAAKANFGSLEQLPYQIIVKSIVEFQGRRRRQRG